MEALTTCLMPRSSTHCARKGAASEGQRSIVNHFASAFRRNSFY